LRYETNPVLAENHETSGSAAFPRTNDQLKSFQWCIDWLSGRRSYSGLIVSMHRTGLWRGRLQHCRPSDDERRAQLASGIEESSPQRGSPGQVRAGRDEGEVWTNYHLMQVWGPARPLFLLARIPTDYIDPVRRNMASTARPV